MLPRLSNKEYAALALLVNSGKSEMYGLEMVKASKGELKRGTIYPTLERMAKKGYVESRTVPAPPQAGGLPRRLFKATGSGVQVFRALELAKTLMTSTPTLEGA